MVRTILFDGLTSSPPTHDDDDIDDNDHRTTAMVAMRYLKVHVTLHEKCRCNVALTGQLWDLVLNLIGSIHVISHQLFGEEASSSLSSLSSSSSSSSSISDRSIDLCLDVVRSTLATLSIAASDHVVSGIGREREVEMTLLGMCALLSDECASIVLGIMDPYAGTFEVWSRFVDPDRFVSIMVASGLVDRVLPRLTEERCTLPVGNGSIPIEGGRIRDAMASTHFLLRVCSAASMTAPPPDDPPTLADVKRCALLQSLSILRTVVFRCHGSPGLVVSMIHRQRSDAIRSVDAISLLNRGVVAGSEDVQSLIKKAKEHRARQSGQPNQLDVDEAIAPVLEPFLRIIRGKETNACSIDSNLESLCTQTILFLQHSGFSG
ncbi:hypothetical protein ACHAXA_000504 [Cyclostephanos tholiformis]|uniref:Uncharacterized protein n=1 Tax=Cyclostephanos tholiformis TaxID=382380 RepID=A0ABD3SSN6_9STRA